MFLIIVPSQFEIYILHQNIVSSKFIICTFVGQWNIRWIRFFTSVMQGRFVCRRHRKSLFCWRCCCLLLMLFWWCVVASWLYHDWLTTIVWMSNYTPMQYVPTLVCRLHFWSSRVARIVPSLECSLSRFEFLLNDIRLHCFRNCHRNFESALLFVKCCLQCFIFYFNHTPNLIAYTSIGYNTLELIMIQFHFEC